MSVWKWHLLSFLNMVYVYNIGKLDIFTVIFSFVIGRHFMYTWITAVQLYNGVWLQAIQSDPIFCIRLNEIICRPTEFNIFSRMNFTFSADGISHTQPQYVPLFLFNLYREFFFLFFPDVFSYTVLFSPLPKNAGVCCWIWCFPSCVFFYFNSMKLRIKLFYRKYWKSFDNSQNRK